jgi:hypothetical protein
VSGMPEPQARDHSHLCLPAAPGSAGVGPGARGRSLGPRPHRARARRSGIAPGAPVGGPARRAPPTPRASPLPRRSPPPSASLAGLAVPFFSAVKTVKTPRGPGRPTVRAGRHWSSLVVMLQPPKGPRNPDMTGPAFLQSSENSENGHHWSSCRPRRKGPRTPTGRAPMAPRACASFRASQAARKSTRRGARTAPCQTGPRGLHRSQTGPEPIALARSPPPAGGHQVTPARQPVRPLLGGSSE